MFTVKKVSLPDPLPDERFQRASNQSRAPQAQDCMLPTLYICPHRFSQYKVSSPDPLPDERLRRVSNQSRPPQVQDCMSLHCTCALIDVHSTEVSPPDPLPDERFRGVSNQSRLPRTQDRMSLRLYVYSHRCSQYTSFASGSATSWTVSEDFKPILIQPYEHEKPPTGSM